jgi:hypothetical protein
MLKTTPNHAGQFSHLSKPLGNRATRDMAFSPIQPDSVSCDRAVTTLPSRSTIRAKVRGVVDLRADEASLATARTSAGAVHFPEGPGGRSL